jgi:hypothetical protein
MIWAVRWGPTQLSEQLAPSKLCRDHKPHCLMSFHDYHHVCSDAASAVSQKKLAGVDEKKASPKPPMTSADAMSITADAYQVEERPEESETLSRERFLMQAAMLPNIKFKG